MTARDVRAAAAVPLLTAALASAVETPPADAPPGGLRDIHSALGVGVTFRPDCVTGRLVPASLTWRQYQYEFFAAHFRDQRINGLTYQGYPAHIPLAPPMWAFAPSRRLSVYDRPQFKGCFGTGIACLLTNPCATEDEHNDHTLRLDYFEPVYHGRDKLNGARLNHAPQLGFRVYPQGHSQGFDLNRRHISNAGMMGGNRGEDFVSALLVF